MADPAEVARLQLVLTTWWAQAKAARDLAQEIEQTHVAHLLVRMQAAGVSRQELAGMLGRSTHRVDQLTGMARAHPAPPAWVTTNSAGDFNPVLNALPKLGLDPHML